MNAYFTSGDVALQNRAFLYGDAVRVSFFVRNGKIIMAEECYFFLMASMRKMRMNIPLTYTLEFFQDLFSENLLSAGVDNGIIRFQVFRANGETALQKEPVSFSFDVLAMPDVLAVQKNVNLDLIKEISVNTSLLSNIRVHCPENIYAGIYAAENGLDEVILLNPDKRIARSISGNLLFLEGNLIKIPKQSEGAYISPLMENLVTFIHKNQMAEVQESEIIAFESQKADEILLVSDEKGIFGVSSIRNKSFGLEKFTSILDAWKQQF